MSSLFTVAVLLAAVTLASLVSSNHEEDFAFDISDDLEVELDGGQLRKWNNREIVARVGKTFHLVIPKDAFEGTVEKFEVNKNKYKFNFQTI